MLKDKITRPLSEYREVQKPMGNRFEITVVADEETWAREKISCAIAEILRIEKLLTTFDENIQTNQINWHAGIGAVKADLEIFNLIHI